MASLAESRCTAGDRSVPTGARRIKASVILAAVRDRSAAAFVINCHRPLWARGPFEFPYNPAPFPGRGSMAKTSSRFRSRRRQGRRGAAGLAVRHGLLVGVRGLAASAADAVVRHRGGVHQRSDPALQQRAPPDPHRPADDAGRRRRRVGGGRRAGPSGPRPGRRRVPCVPPRHRG